MENPTDTTPIIFCTQHTSSKYDSSAPTIISWTSRFAESVDIRRLICLPIEELDESDETSNWETMTSLITLNQLSSPFLALQPYTLDTVSAQSLKFQCHSIPDNLNLVDSANVILDPTGGTWAMPTRTDVRRSLTPTVYGIHCCVRPTSRCCFNDLPVEILEHIFSSFEDIYYTLWNPHYKLYNTIPLVCKLWSKIFVGFEPEPTFEILKMVRLKQLPSPRFKWRSCECYNPFINFHRYIHLVVQFQPNLRDVFLVRPPSSQDSPLDDLLILAKVPTLENVSLYDWNVQEVFMFLRAGQYLKLDKLAIHGMTEGNQGSIDVTTSNVKSQSQLLKVKNLTIKIFDDSIHKILNCFKKYYIQHFWMIYDVQSFKLLKEPIQLIGFNNLSELHIHGGNDESNIVSFDFISTTCTPSNLPNLHYLDLEYCFVDPTDVRCLLDMPELNKVEIIFFMGQKTEQNELTTSQMMTKFISKNASNNGNISYSDGDGND